MTDLVKQSSLPPVKQELALTEADRSRLSYAMTLYRQGEDLDDIEREMNFGPSELLDLVRSQDWQDLALERETLRRRSLMDNVMSLGSKVMQSGKLLNRRLQDVARTAVTAEEVKDLSSALSSISNAAKNISDAVGGVQQATSVQGNVIQNLQIVSRPQ